MKVLIISNNAVSSTQNNGKTVKSFFKNLPNESLAQLYFGTNEDPDTSVCSTFYRITEIDIFKSILKLKFSTSNTHNKLISSKKKHNLKDNRLLSFVKKHKKSTALLRELLWSFNTWDTKELNDWILNFKPDVIFAVLGGNIYSHRIVMTISKRYSIPFVSFYTDDYIINDTSKNYFQKCHYNLLCKTYKKSIFKSSLCYVIGEKMRKDYSAIFKTPFNTLVNAVDVSMFSLIDKTEIDITKPIIISFIGGIHLNRWKSICKLGKLFNELNEENNWNIQLNVYTVKEPDEEILQAFNKSYISYKGGLEYDEVLVTIKKSHFLLHVESFDKENRLYTKYSISTKIPEYLASNRGIIAYGPEEIASIEIFKDNNFGYCLPDNTKIAKQIVVEAINDYNTYDFERMRNYSFKKYNQEIVSTELLDNLVRIASSK